MTYNVHRCQGVDRAYSPQRTAEVIASCHPDIVALQELEIGRARSGYVDQAEIIARDLGMDLQFFPAINVMDERYGDAILSRLPARSVKAGAMPSIPWWKSEPRGALWVEIEVQGIALQVFTTHLGLIGLERILQIETLLGPEWLGHPDCREPYILLGDFNATPISRGYRRLAAHMLDVQRVSRKRPLATFSTTYPTLRIDHIFVSKTCVYVLDYGTSRTPLARLASDHFPVIAELNIRSPDEASPNGGGT